jgi:hypothetical protein
LRTIQALAEESCIQSALYASISRNKTASNALFGRFPVKNYSKESFRGWLRVISEGVLLAPHVTGLARLNHIVQSFQSLFNGRLAVPTMNLVKIDVVHSQAAKAAIDFRYDGLA